MASWAGLEASYGHIWLSSGHLSRLGGQLRRLGVHLGRLGGILEAILGHRGHLRGDMTNERWIFRVAGGLGRDRTGKHFGKAT